MSRENRVFAKIDWISVSIYLLLVVFGWLNIYAANYTPDNPVFFDTAREYSKQLIWIGFSFFIVWLIMMTDSKFFVSFSFVFYGLAMFLLLAVFIFGREVNGARTWFEFGSVRFQPSELTKVGTSLTLAYIMSRYNFNLSKFRSMIFIGAIWLVPPILILLQNDTGSALVYGVFLLVFYREGMSPYILLFVGLSAFVAIITLVLPNVAVNLIILAIGLGALYQLGSKKPVATVAISILGVSLLIKVVDLITPTGINWELLTLGFLFPIAIYFFVISYLKRSMLNTYGIIVIIGFFVLAYSTDYIVNDVLSEHQRTRIAVMLGQKNDPKGVEYNVIQSKIAIGSGGFSGKGFLEGTQTKFNFVPEQSTDFIFCTVGEEWGFLGSVGVIALFIGLIMRLIYLAEKQHSTFSRIYGYCVVSIIFFHFAINIGMTIGLVPVIGIPLPFFSYGGSSLWSFTILLFIFLKLDSNRTELLR